MIKEGPRATVTVEIVGLPDDVPATDARAAVPMADGALFDYIEYDAAKIPLLALVENAGYPHAQLDASVLANPTTNKAILRYAVDAGPKATFGEVEVIGTDGELAEAVRARAGMKAG